PLKRCGRNAHERKGRITPADVGVVKENLPELKICSYLLEPASRVGNGNEMLAYLFLADLSKRLVIEIFHERKGLGGAARLGRNYKDRLRKVQTFSLFEHSPRVGAVENGDVEVTLLYAVRFTYDKRR